MFLQTQIHEKGEIPIITKKIRDYKNKPTTNSDIETITEFKIYMLYMFKEIINEMKKLSHKLLKKKKENS